MTYPEYHSTYLSGGSLETKRLSVAHYCTYCLQVLAVRLTARPRGDGVCAAADITTNNLRDGVKEGEFRLAANLLPEVG